MSDARALLRSYGADALLVEHATWESVRDRTKAISYARPPDAAPRTIISLDGIPGAGKSTTQRWLQPALGAAYFSMARFAESRGVTADARLKHQLEAGEAHPVDHDFIALLAECPSRYVLLEKFPRSVVEAASMLDSVHRHGWRFEVLHLELPGDCVALSTRRQLERGPRHGRMPEPQYAQHRALVHVARASSMRETLRAHGVPIHAFDMTRPRDENEAAIRRALGLDFAALPWHLAPLATLERVAKRIGVDAAWAACGSVYRPFWNERFGPVQRPTDIDVAVNHEREVEPLLEALEREAPGERWSVLCPSTRLRQRYGIETGTAPEAKGYATFMHRTGLVRLRNGVVDVCLPPGAEACLRNGSVALNAALLDRLSGAQRAEVLERETHHLPRALSDYPGLQVAPATARLLEGGEHWRDHRPRHIGTSWRALKAAASEAQGAHRARTVAFCRRALGPEEKKVALEILAFHQTSDCTARAPELPPRSMLSRQLSGLHGFARDADDATFGEWFLDQAHHHRPAGGADPYLRSVLDLTLFAGKLRALEREQSAMHQGWALERHLAQSVLELRTDALLERLAPHHGAEWRTDLRLCMRLAMLFHDTGKLLGRRPRRHALISARLFARFKPSWFPPPLVALTQWLIRTHDLFGAFGRGLTDKLGQTAGDYRVDLSLTTSYFGALDSQAVRDVLVEPGLPLDEAAAINKAIWRADVGSIAALRWLLPVAELVERLVLVKQSMAGSGAERRRPRGGAT